MCSKELNPLTSALSAFVDFSEPTLLCQSNRYAVYRAYSSKTAPRPGQWRVNIATAEGHAIGRVRFSVETQAVPPAVTLKILK
mgnify:CR=1 FL=1